MISVWSVGGPVMPEKRTEEVKAEAEQRNAAKQGSDYEARKGSAAADAKGAEKIMSVEDISSRTTEADKRENLTTRFGNLSEKTILIIMLVAWPLSVSALSLV